MEKTANKTNAEKHWYVYILRCADNSLYTGITKDLQKRLCEHNHNNRSGSRYTRSRRPVNLIYSETHKSRSDACKREALIKKLPKQLKENLIIEQEQTQTFD